MRDPDNVRKFPERPHPNPKGFPASPLRPLLKEHGPALITKMRQEMQLTRKQVCALYGMRAPYLADMEAARSPVSERYYRWLLHLYDLHKRHRL